MQYLHMLYWIKDYRSVQLQVAFPTQADLVQYLQTSPYMLKEYEVNDMTPLEQCKFIKALLQNEQYDYWYYKKIEVSKVSEFLLNRIY